jgi:hypothetical protein
MFVLLILYVLSPLTARLTNERVLLEIFRSSRSHFCLVSDLQLFSIDFYCNLNISDVHSFNFAFALEFIFTFHASGKTTCMNEPNHIL